MEELIKVTEKEGKQLVSARDLYDFLEVSERFSRFMDRNLEFGFENGVDYTPYQNVHPSNGQEFLDYALTLDTAKEISMIQRSEKGKEARRYFIACEKKSKEIDLSYENALILIGVDKAIVPQIANVYRERDQIKNKLTIASVKIEEDKPKVVFAESVIGSSNSILVRQFAKDLCDSGFETGEKRLYEWFRANKYLNVKNEPYQNYVSMGLFEIITRTIGSGMETFTSKTTKITGKGAVYFAEKIKS